MLTRPLSLPLTLLKSRMMACNIVTSASTGRLPRTLKEQSECMTSSPKVHAVPAGLSLPPRHRRACKLSRTTDLLSDYPSRRVLTAFKTRGAAPVAGCKITMICL